MQEGLKMEPLISVIIPVYNVEKYLKRCLDSVLKQTYKNTEIILIDDGSQDNSSNICDEYLNKDSRIRVFHKDNGGLSSARNYGIDHSKGQYIMFVDSDDYLDLHCIEFLYDLISKGNCLLSICSLYVVYERTGYKRDCGTHRIVKLKSEDAISKLCYHDEVDTCAYAKLYNKKLFDTIRYPEGKIFEDIGTTYKLFALSGEIMCGFFPLYYYVKRPGSIVTSAFSLRKLDFIEMTDQMADFVEERYPNLSKATCRRRVFARISTLNQILKDDSLNDVVKCKEKEIVSFIRRHSISVLLDLRAPFRDKIAICLIYLNINVYKLVWKLYSRHRE